MFNILSRLSCFSRSHFRLVVRDIHINVGGRSQRVDVKQAHTLVILIWHHEQNLYTAFSVLDIFSGFLCQLLLSRCDLESWRLGENMGAFQKSSGSIYLFSVQHTVGRLFDRHLYCFVRKFIYLFIYFWHSYQWLETCAFHIF